MISEHYKKVVVGLTTTLSEAAIRAQLTGLEGAMRAQVIAIAAAEPDLTLVLPTIYGMSMRAVGGEFEIYPKLLFRIDGLLDENDVDARFDGFPPAFQGIFRGLTANPATTIQAWHLHFSTGAVDQPGP